MWRWKVENKALKNDIIFRKLISSRLVMFRHEAVGFNYFFTETF